MAESSPGSKRSKIKQRKVIRRWPKNSVEKTTDLNFQSLASCYCYCSKNPYNLWGKCHLLPCMYRIYKMMVAIENNTDDGKQMTA